MSEAALSDDHGELQFGSAASGTGAFVAGKYRIFGTLGRGGMADVFLAAALGAAGFNKLVVVKKLREARADDPSFVNMFLDEARLAARLNHPNIVHTYEIGEQSDGYFIAMEYLEGQQLNRVANEMRRRGEPMAPAMAAHLMAEALLGLHHAHEMKDYDGRRLEIVHRDVSPQNLYVTYDGQVKVLDFGIAKAAMNITQTQAGVTKGKFSYMAPEQAIGDDVDRRSDVFALGIVLWELLAGERLFHGSSAVALQKLLNLEIPAPSSRNPLVSAALDAIVLKSLRRDPQERFQSAQEMSNALQDQVYASGRVIRHEDVARRLTEMFGSLREDMQRQIQAHMATLPAPSASGDFSHVTNMAGPPSYTASGVMDRLSGVPSAPGREGTQASIIGLAPASAPARSTRWIAIGALGLGALAVGGFLFTRASASRAPATATATADTAKKAAAGGASSDAESFHLTLSSDPLEAQIEWVGKPVGQTPLMIDLLTGPQTFILSREGYFNATVMVNVTDAMAGRTESRTVVMVPRSKSPGTATVKVEPMAPRSGSSGNAKVEPSAAAAPLRAMAPASALAPTVAPKAEDPALPTAAAAIAASASPPPSAAAIAAAPSSVVASAPTAAPAATSSLPTVLPFGPEMSRPVLLSGSDPVFTREAIVSGVEGVMIAKCTITMQGTLQNCRIVKGLPYMDKAMLDALATRKYAPVMYQGRPVAVEYVFNTRLAKH